MGHSTKAHQWRELIHLFNEGDLGVSAFCQLHGMPEHRFYYWRNKLAAETSQNRQLVPVVFEPDPTPTVAACIRLPNGVEINSCDADQLERLLPALASL